MSEIKSSNIPSMNVGKLVESLGEAYCKVINSNGGKQKTDDIVKYAE